MRGMIAIALLAVACGGPEGQSITLGCETNLDAGSPCESCPGNAGSTQADILQADGGMATVRECQCPAQQGMPPRSLAWRSCPAVVEFHGAGPAVTCAGIAAAFTAFCQQP